MSSSLSRAGYSVQKNKFYFLLVFFCFRLGSSLSYKQLDQSFSSSPTSAGQSLFNFHGLMVNIFKVDCASHQFLNALTFNRSLLLLLLNKRPHYLKVVMLVMLVIFENISINVMVRFKISCIKTCERDFETSKKHKYVFLFRNLCCFFRNMWQYLRPLWQIY